MYDGRQSSGVSEVIIIGNFVCLYNSIQSNCFYHVKACWLYS